MSVSIHFIKFQSIKLYQSINPDAERLIAAAASAAEPALLHARLDATLGGRSEERGERSGEERRGEEEDADCNRDSSIRVTSDR